MVQACLPHWCGPACPAAAGGLKKARTVSTKRYMSLLDNLIYIAILPRSPEYKRRCDSLAFNAHKMHKAVGRLCDNVYTGRVAGGLKLPALLESAVYSFSSDRSSTACFL